MYLLARLAKTADLKDLEHPNNIKPLKNILKIFMSKFHDYFAFMRYSRTSLATSSRKRSPVQNSARVSLFWVSNGFNELLEFVGYFP